VQIDFLDAPMRKATMKLQHAPLALVILSWFWALSAAAALAAEASQFAPKGTSAPAPVLKETPEPPWATVYQKTLPGIVYILSEGLCSGAFVAEDLVLTAWHCVVGTRTLRVGYNKVTRQEGRYDFEEGIVVVAADPRQDLAILRLPRKHAGKILNVAPRQYVYKTGQDVGTIGHPLALTPLTSTGLLEMQLNMFTRGPVAKVNEDLVVADLLVLPGNSGGPVIDLAGDIVGVVSARHREGDLGYFVPVSKIQPLLERARVSTKSIGRRPFFGSNAVSLFGAFEADRYGRALYGASQNIYTLSPSVTVLNALRATFTMRVGPQKVQKRQWDFAFVYPIEISRIVEVEAAFGLGQVFYYDETSGQPQKSALLKGTLGLSGMLFSAAFPFADLSRPSLSFGLDLLALY
jgi:S1-C subfamily serine protease